MKLKIILAIALFFVSVLCAYADFAPKLWQYSAPVESIKTVGSEYAAITISRDVYSKSQINFNDVRLVSSDGMEIPYKLLVDEQQTSEKTYNPDMLNKSVVTGKYSSFDLDLGKPGVMTNSVTIQTYSQNFMRRVEIHGSEDGSTWAVLRSDGSIFDFTQEFHSQRLNVPYPQTTFRYIRVKVWNYGQKPLEIDGLSLAREDKQSASEELLFDGKGDVSQNSKEKSTDAILDLGVRGLPVRRVEILTSSVNFDRTVEIAGSKDKHEWTDLGGGQILKYDTSQFKDKNLSITCDGGGFRFLRVRIRNFDDQPINLSGIKVYGIRHRLFFKYETGKTYQVYYGRKDAKTPVYDIAETYRYVSSEGTPTLRLGQGAENPRFVMPIASVPWMEKNPWVLWAVLSVAVILLGILTVKSIIATKQMTPKE